MKHVKFEIQIEIAKKIEESRYQLIDTRGAIVYETTNPVKLVLKLNSIVKLYN